MNVQYVETREGQAMKPTPIRECEGYMESYVKAWVVNEAPPEQLEILAILRTLAAGKDARTTRVDAAGECVALSRWTGERG